MKQQEVLAKDLCAEDYLFKDNYINNSFKVDMCDKIMPAI